MQAVERPHEPTPQEQQAQELQTKAFKAVTKARAHMHPGMNRKQRRQAAKAAGVFKIKGLGTRHLIQPEVLEAKTIRNGKK